jgi:hypothetical protein
MENTMKRIFKITHITNGRQQHVAVEARDADEAQERFVDYCERVGIVHGAIASIRTAA